MTINAAGEGILTFKIPTDYMDSVDMFKGGYGVLLDTTMKAIPIDD